MIIMVELSNRRREEKGEREMTLIHQTKRRRRHSSHVFVQPFTGRARGAMIALCNHPGRITVEVRERGRNRAMEGGYNDTGCDGSGESFGEAKKPLHKSG